MKPCLLLFLADAVVFDDVVHVLVTATRQVDEHRALVHRLGEFHAVRNGVRAFDGGDDALETGEFEERINGLLVAGV